MLNKPKLPSVDYPILDMLAGRYSPYAFEPRQVEHEKLLSCFEAARWAASSYNEQPWSFIIAMREDEIEFARMLECLVEANQAWARNAGVLLVTVAAKSFARNATPNRMAEHDVGLAVGNLTVQATSLGLAVHQMAGIDIEKTRSTYRIPETHAPLTAIALGYAADPDASSSTRFAERDRTRRSRKPLSEFVFTGEWQRPIAGS